MIEAVEAMGLESLFYSFIPSRSTFSTFLSRSYRRVEIGEVREEQRLGRDILDAGALQHLEGCAHADDVTRSAHSLFQLHEQGACAITQIVNAIANSNHSRFEQTCNTECVSGFGNLYVPAGLL